MSVDGAISMRAAFAVFSATMMALIVPSNAQAPSSHSTSHMAQVEPQTPVLTCDDFQHNPDGSWSPRHQIQIGSIMMGSGVSFRPGVSFNGIDLAATLDKHCQ